MKDLVETIAAHEREEQKDDALFERVARGTASPEELESLEARAASDESIRLRLDASRPLDDAALDRIAARIAKPAEHTRSPEVGGGRRDTTVVSLWKRRAVMLAGPLALAAAMVLYITAGPGLGPSGPTIPSYAISATSEKEMRGDAPVATRLRLGSHANDRDARFTIVLTPETAVPAKVVAYAFVMSVPEPTPLEAKIETSAEGAIKISGASRTLDGAKELRVVVGPPSSIGRFDDAITRAQKGTSDEHVRVMSIPIERE